jgi:outer membrane protein TolC
MITISVGIVSLALVQAATPTSLQECIATGLEQNYQIRMVRNEQKITENNLTPGNAGYLPTLDLNVSYSGTESNSRQEPRDGSPALVQSGISNQTLSAGATVNWTVFDGFNIQANYSRLKELQQVGTLQTRMKIEGYISDLAAEYFNFVRQTIRTQNLESAVKLSRERLRIVEARYHIGNLSRLDLQQARVDFNTDSSRLIRQHEVLYASRISLNRLMSRQAVETPFVAADTGFVFDALLNKEQLLNETLSNNTYMLLADREKNLRVLDLQSARSANYPYVRLSGGYGYTDNLYEVATNRRQNSLGFNYGISIGYNIFDGFNRVRRQKNAQIRIENQEMAMEELRIALHSEFANLWMAYYNNMNLTLLEKENLTHAKENYEIAMERYMLGELAGIQLREAQNNLLEAEERLLQSQYATKLCEISLLEISGNVKRYL